MTAWRETARMDRIVELFARLTIRARAWLVVTVVVEMVAVVHGPAEVGVSPILIAGLYVGVHWSHGKHCRRPRFWRIVELILGEYVATHARHARRPA